MGHEVEAGHLGQRLEPLPEGRQLEPRGEEAGGLGALSGAQDREHDTSLAVTA
jgi:hypothetical protein